MRKFARQLDDWLKTALEDAPISLQQTKIDCEYVQEGIYRVVLKSENRSHFSL